MTKPLNECTSFKLYVTFNIKKVELSKRYNKANNNYLKSYDPKQESKHVIRVDASNLYHYAMSTFFRTNGFKWIDPKDFDSNE